MKTRKYLAVVAFWVTVGIALLLSLFAQVQESQLSCQPDCAGADLRGIWLYRPVFLGDPEMAMFVIRLGEVDFHDADLSQANLRNTFLRKCNFWGASLNHADLQSVDFAWSLMAETDLRGANLSEANLYATDLHGADLRGANLTGAYLREANLAGITYDSATQWPDGYEPDEAHATFIE